MTGAGLYAITFTPAARRRLGALPLPAAAALYEHLTGPVAENPRRLGKPLDAPFEEVLSTRRGDYRALSPSMTGPGSLQSWRSPTGAMPTAHDEPPTLKGPPGPAHAPSS
jgi:mRNA interferase RelE/StbE